MEKSFYIAFNHRDKNKKLMWHLPYSLIFFLSLVSPCQIVLCYAAKKLLPPVRQVAWFSEERRAVIWEAEAWKCARRKWNLCECVETLVLKEKKKTGKTPIPSCYFFLIFTIAVAR